MDYVFLRFLNAASKNVKSRVLALFGDFQKNVKNVFSNYGSNISLQATEK